MSTKQELLSKFASQTGADLPGIQSKPSDRTDVITEADAKSTTVQEDEELFKDSFSDRTKVPPWQSPKYKGFIVILCVLPVVLGVGWIFKDGIPKPKFEAKAPRTTPIPQPDDEDQPKFATDGEWASYAATNGMRQQFANAANSENTDALKKFQSQANFQKNTQGSSSTAKPNTRSVPTSETAETHIPTDDIPSYRPVSRSYTSLTPPVSIPQSRSVAPTIPAFKADNLSKPPIITRNSQSSAQPEQRSPQQRIAAIISATSTEASSETTTAASTTIPSQSGAIVSNAAKPLAPQSTYTSTEQAYLPSEAAVIDGQPQTLINRSQSAKGVLLTSIAFTSGDYASLADQPVEIKLSEALGDIPVGARIDAVVEATESNYSGNSKSQVVRLKPTALIVNNAEIPLPDGAIMLSGKNGTPLVAKRGGRNFLRFLSGLTGTVAGGAGLTNFGASQNVRIGNSSYFKSIGANVATSLVSNAAQQLQQAGEGDEILILKAGSSITVSVHKPLVLPQIPNPQPVVQQTKPEVLPELADFKGAADATPN